MENNNISKPTNSHQNYGENYYAPPPMFQNNNDLESNSTQYYQAPQMDSDAMNAMKAQQASQKDQSGMYQPIFPSSDKENKPKKDYTIYYQHPEISEDNKPADPLYNKLYGKNGGGNSGNFNGYEKVCMGHCGNCYDCQMRSKREAEKRREEEECDCLMRCMCECLFAICLGICEAQANNR